MVTESCSVRTDWTREEIADLFDLPFMDLVFRAAEVHRANHDPNAVQLSTLLSIKTGGCAEDCGYCSQSASADTGLKATKLMDVRAVLQSAAQAKDNGSSRFCMGAAWRSPKDRDMPAIIEMVKGVRQMGLETCMTLGMLSESQARQLAEAGLDYYNHNIDTSPENYANVISTRTFEDRIDTLETVRAAGINVCSGGIVGLGETREDRVGFLHALASMDHPESVPINALVPVKGTVLGNMLADTPLAKIDEIEFVRTVAVARIAMPRSIVRLSAGRESMSDSTQALCFLAGAGSIFTGDKLLTTGNAGDDADGRLFARLGLHPMDVAPSALAVAARVSLTLALMLQAAVAPPPTPQREAFRAVDAAKAVDLVKTTCWAHLRNDDALEASIAMLPFAFAGQPHGNGPTRNWRAAEGAISYAADLPPNVPSPQCIVRVMIGGVVDQLPLAARIATALSLPSGSTRANTHASDTRWDVAQPDGRIARLIVSNVPVTGGANIRFTAMLLPQAQ